MKQMLTDPFGRTIEYVRLSVTDQCDLRCFYCLPKGYKDFKNPDHWLRFAEIEQVLRAFAFLGVKRIRITGGEPLLRKGITQLIHRIHTIEGIEDLSLSTNAVKLKKYAAGLQQSGVSRLNVSLDSLKPSKFKEITGGKLEKVIEGLMLAKELGFKPIKINAVIMQGINDDEIEDLVLFCIEHGFTLRFIETMPMGDTGQKAGQYYVDLQKVKNRLERNFKLIPSTMSGGGPARYYKVAGSDLRIGFITPISQHFCQTCNRVRLSVDGTLYLCLGQNDNFELRPYLREGISDRELQQLIVQAINLKPEKHDFNQQPQHVVRFMSSTGG